jgi:hypothetical protein
MTPHQKLFIDIYTRNLRESQQADPKSYAWPAEELPDVVKRMTAAILRGSFNKDGRAFRATCRELGIKHTYLDIECYLGGYSLA